MTRMRARNGLAPAIAPATMIIMALLVCSGAILFSLGLIAEYLGVALHVLVGKPLYLTVDSPRPGTSIDRRSREH